MQRQRDDAPDAHLLAGFLDASAVDPNVPGVDDRLSEGAALEEPDEEEVAIDPHVFFLSLASSAKAWLEGVRRSVLLPRRPRHRQASPARAKPMSLISAPSASWSSPIEVASSESTGSAPPAERTFRAWLARRSARSIRTQVRPARR